MSEDWDEPESSAPASSGGFQPVKNIFLLSVHILSLYCVGWDVEPYSFTHILSQMFYADYLFLS